MEPKVKRILVPTDFSSTAENALTLATRLASRFGAELHALNVRVILEEPHLDTPSQEEIARLISRADQGAEAALARQNGTRPSAEIQPHLVRGMSAAEVITEMCATLDCDLVVMGTHGRRGLKHMLLGSVAEAVLRTAPVPVLTVRPDVQISDDPIQRLLVAHDFSAQSEQALKVAAFWAAKLDSAVTLIHVVEPVVYPDFYAIDTLGEHALEKVSTRSLEALQQIKDTSLSDVKCDVEVLVGRAGEKIAEHAGSGEFQLVIMGTRGMSPLEHLLLGSVADYVLRRCPVPLLAVRS